MSRLERRSFAELAANPLEPCVVVEEVAAWPALRWSAEALGARFGEVQLPVVDGENRRLGAISLRHHLEAGEPPLGGYTKGWQFERDADSLMEDLALHPALHSWFDLVVEPKRPKLRWIFFGKAGSSSPWHRDLWFTHAWSLQIAGVKRWSLAAPGEAPRGELWHHEQVPGELLYVPSAWWHRVENRSESLSVTGNVVNDANYERVGREMESEGARGWVAALRELREHVRRRP